jgi:membrane-associated phospholipid phosphatase
VFLLLVTLTERRRRFRVLAGASGAGAVALVALSRVYLDRHRLSDVIGGFILGTASC